MWYCFFMSTGISPEVRGASASELLSDGALSYLAQREQKDAFVMVEFGHDALPVAFKHPHTFTGGRAYIGYEAWLRDPRGEKRATVQDLHASNGGNERNIHFQTLSLGGTVRSANDRGAIERWYEGDYNPSTPLPDSSVEEVFIGNVFGDPYVANVRERTDALLEEATRILAEDGTLVVRETITPFRTMGNFEASVAASGLSARARVTPRDAEWDALEHHFSNDRIHTLGSYYLLLTKEN